MRGELTLGVSGWRLHGQRTGVGRYLLSIIESLSADVLTGEFSDVNVYTQSRLAAAEVRLPDHVNNIVLESRLPMLPWDNLRLAPSATDAVVLYPSFSRPLIARGATVVVTHDAHVKVVPEMYRRRDRIAYGPLYGWSARKATIVVTTSEATKWDIVREWDVDPAKIRVTYMAASAEFRPLDGLDQHSARAEMLGEATPYFMFVGKISGRRNIPELLKALAEFRRRGHPHNLLLVGPDYAVDAVRALARTLDVTRYVLTKSFVSDTELNRLYNCADAFIMPSAYENGSLPVFEAQATGTPVISVATEGTREITGDTALLIPQLRVAELVAAMERLATDRDLRNELSRAGLENSRRFSWKRCATETVAACREAARIHG